MTTRQKIISLFVLAACVIAWPAHASTTYNIDCTYFDTFDGSASCSSGIVTLTGISDAVYMASQHGGPFITGTWYISATVVGTGSTDVCFRGNCGSPITLTPGTTVAQSISSGGGVGGSGGAWLFIGDNGDRLTGTVSSICITDTSGACEAGPPPTPDPTSTLQSFSTTTQLVDNPGQNLFNGFLLFFISMILPLWFFKKKVT